jgi:hypothetical protein
MPFAVKLGLFVMQWRRESIKWDASPVDEGSTNFFTDRGLTGRKHTRVGTSVVFAARCSFERQPSFADHTLTGHSTFDWPAARFPWLDSEAGKRSAGRGFRCEQSARSDGARYVDFTNRNLTGRRVSAFGDQGGARRRASASAEFVVANFFPPIAL